MLRDPSLEGSARCALMLRALREVVAAYQAAPEKVLARDLTGRISTHVAFLISCRPLSVRSVSRTRSRQ